MYTWKNKKQNESSKLKKVLSHKEEWDKILDLDSFFKNGLKHLFSLACFTGISRMSSHVLYSLQRYMLKKRI